MKRTIWGNIDLKHIQSGINHFRQRLRERFGLKMGEYEVYLLSDEILKGNHKKIGRISISRFFYQVKLNGKKLMVLFDHKLDTPITVYTPRMLRESYPNGFNELAS